jgi:hypothetical protein
MIRRSGVRSRVAAVKVARAMCRFAASGHRLSRQLWKFAAAARIASAVIDGSPDAPDSPLHGRGAVLGRAAGEIVPVADWAIAGAKQAANPTLAAIKAVVIKRN